MPVTHMAERINRDEEQVLRRAMLRINEQGWGIAIGMVLGLGLFIATNFLVIRGGESVGPHLALLGVYFPGYRVTFLGSLIGFAYGFAYGALAGIAMSVVYNRLVHAHGP